MAIKMLARETINQIAAGEVIVRPVSVVKELIENAVDAKASRITIHIENGGRSLISVKDNGHGIPYHEVGLAFKRHATSKLTFIEDLQTIATLGFRGEALASIAAVSKLSIVTRHLSEEVGSESYYEGGTLIRQRVTPYERGTAISVRDLFYNLPARQKHIAQDKKEEALIRDLVERLALSKPAIAFVLKLNGREIFRTPGRGDFLESIEALYGRKISKGLREVDYVNAPMSIKGYISDLSVTRSAKDMQIIFINERYVQNSLLLKQLEEAYEGYLMQHRYPVAFLFIDLPGKMLDVNIHPAKTEVQILNESLVALLFKQGIRETIKKENLVVDYAQTENGIETETAPTEEEPKTVDFFETLGEPQLKSPTQNKEIDGFKVDFPQSERKETKEKPEDDTEVDIEAFMVAEKPEASAQSLQKTEGSAYKPGLAFAHGRIVGQLFLTYIMVEQDQTCWLIDQHAAHEAYLYEEIKKNLTEEKALPMQSLLAAQPMTCTPAEWEAYLQIKDDMHRYGFETDIFGDRTFVVRSVPMLLGHPQDPHMAMGVLEEVLYHKKATASYLDERFAMMACKAAVKGNQFLTEAEIRALLIQITKLENPYICPHGRPIILQLKERELQKLFKRVL
ncbi:MAG: DNA mismatch repair endonuclease MutL [Eubacteriaceae bacterium]|jgi:DNA mismatch repair protein MutL|nr:DNA mismatch repair endonuclease MutL [Eubacteriaceae bacterium]